MRAAVYSLRSGEAALLLAPIALAQSIAEINGPKFLSPYNGQIVNVSGLVTARHSSGFWIRSLEPDDDPRTSESIYVYGSNLGNFTTGDIVSLSGSVEEYRSNKDYNYLAEISRPRDITILSSGNPVAALEIGKDTANPPTEDFSSLDLGGLFGVPNDVNRVSGVDPELQPDKFGIDFWESLLGELVTIKNPRAIAKPNQYGDTWVVGEWPVTGLNKRGGLTMRSGDANPEAIIIGTPLDGTRNPNDGRLGDELEDITGVVYQAFGFYRILPTTAFVVKAKPSPELPKPEKFLLKGTCAALTVGSYNIENFYPGSPGIEGRAEHIARYLDAPDLIFLQEVQDNNGQANDGVVSADESHKALIDAVAQLTGWRYDFIDIAPENNMDGGAPGGNIRCSYLYNPTVLRLKNANPGSATDAVKVQKGSKIFSGPTLNFNPGRIDPGNSAWDDSRKPIVAHWEFSNLFCRLSDFFTVNVHFGSKGGSTTLHGDARPPVNKGVEKRTAQANITAGFISEILKYDRNAAVIAAGDFNEFAFVQPLEVFTETSGMVDLDVAARVPETERYTYIFDSNCQQLDHMYVSPKIARRSPRFEHVHVNTWLNYDGEVSDHDPSVARLNVI
ncbi:hypothetical protein DL768_009628 [Monosporascus sp. mg162]|nr:hypothetical protein DL768_009628 [Monosporascus sp. mg162]